MKVLYFHQHFSTPEGATGIRSYEMARKLVNRGHQVTMVCGSYSGGKTGLSQNFEKGVRRGYVDGIEVIEFALSYSNNDGFIKRTLLFLGFALRSVKVALFEKYDLLFATTTPLTAAIPGIFGRWLKNKPFVFEVRDLWPELPRAMKVITNPVVLWAMGILEWLAYKSAHRLIALSPGIKQGILRLNVAEANVTQIPNGCDIQLFSQGESLRWRPEGVMEGDFMAIFTGTHGKANGLKAVLDTAEILKQQNQQHIKLVLVGQGKEKCALQQLAREKQLTNVIFHEPVDKVKLSGLMASADVGMQILANIPAFYYGTSPNKFFDYLSAGLPVITNYPGWVADMLKENQCGIAVPPEQPQAFANALVELANKKNIDGLGEMGLAARRLAEKHFDRSQLSEQFVDWLEESEKRA